MWPVPIVCSLLVLGALGQVSEVPEVPEVTLSQGTVRGSLSSEGNYYEFHGIPYADSTSGSHRFKAPSPPPTFTDTFIADRKDIKCVRPLGQGYEGTEDCLVASVYTPSLNSSSELSVMVWIKGKQFDSVVNPELSFREFMEHDVVIVSLNFRESILGFLCLGTETAPGNAGLKDIIAGLRWVKDNIESFGGNPESITLFGHGSGAAAVDLVTLSPMGNDLVNKAIAQSGTALAPWAVTRDNLKYAVLVAEALGHTITDIETLSEVFTRTSVAALMGIINELDLTDNSLAFAPCIEREDLEDVEPFLTKSPYETIRDGEMLQIPFMTGLVEYEGTIRAEEAIRSEDDWLHNMETSFTDFIQPDLKFDTDEQEQLVSDEIKTFYFDENVITIDKYFEYHGDTIMSVSAVRETKLRVITSTAPIYLYQFSYKGSLGEPFEGIVSVEGAAHGEELAYLFPTVTVGRNEDDVAISRILIERWANFAKTGVPTSEDSTYTWLPLTSEAANYLLIRNDETLEANLVDLKSETITFWDTIYEEYFNDAVGRWNLIRDDEDEIDIVDGESAESEGNEDNEDSGEEDGNDEGETDVEDSDEEDEGNSASTAVGYTFLIISLYSVLSKIHTSIILS